MPAAVTSYTLEDQERMAKAANYFAWQHRLVTRELGRRVIEIGCGIGNFTRLILDMLQNIQTHTGVAAKRTELAKFRSQHIARNRAQIRALLTATVPASEPTPAFDLAADKSRSVKVHLQF